MSDTRYAFDSIIVFTNPSSKQADIAAKRIATLEKAFPDKHFQVLEAKSDVAATTRALTELINHEVRQKRRTVLGVAGGDGSVNTAVQLLANPDTPEAVRQTPLVPLGTGNANDLAYMLYGNPSHPEIAFKNGQPIAIRPLQCVITAKDGKTTQWLAANYISFGAIAHGAHELNKPAVRRLAHRRTWYSGLATDMHAIHAALQAPVFQISQNGETQRMRDIVIGNGERLAKVGRMPAHLDRTDLFVVAVQHTWLGRGAIPLEVFKLVIGHAPGQLLRDTTYSFEALEDVRAQYDGEPATVHAGSSVRITHAPLAFQALSTRLSKHA